MFSLKEKWFYTEVSFHPNSNDNFRREIVSDCMGLLYNGHVTVKT